MVGYPESLTDPSYRSPVTFHLQPCHPGPRRQLVVLTYPLVGNYGVPAMAEAGESRRAWLGGLVRGRVGDLILQVVGEVSPSYSHWAATEELGGWMEEQVGGWTG